MTDLNDVFPPILDGLRLLEAKVKRLEAENAKLKSEADYHAKVMWADMDALRAENEKLRSAIKPFADMIREVSDLHEDHDRIEECNELTAGDIRRATDALKETGE